MPTYNVSLSIEVEVTAPTETDAKNLATDRNNWDTDDISIIGATDAVELDEDGCPLD